MAEKESPSGQFQKLLENFASYVSMIAKNGIERISDKEDRLVGESLAKTAIHIVTTFAADAGEMYLNVESDVRTKLDNATRRIGGNVLIETMAANATGESAKLSGFWEKAFEIIEAIKKIIKDIMSVSLFGVSLSDIIGIAVDIDEIFRVLDNILQTIAGLFGGSRLQQRMYEAEVRNIEMEMRLVKLKQLKWSPNSLSAN